MGLTRKDAASIAGVVAIVGAGAAGYWWWSRGHGLAGTVALCAPDDSRVDAVLAVEAFDSSSQRSGVHQHRAFVPIDTRTGKAGKRSNAGAKASCLGGAGASVLVASDDHGIELRDPATGKVVATQAELLGDAAPALAKYDYHAPTHRLRFTTTFNDDFTVDALTRERWPTKSAPAARPSQNAHAVAQLPTFTQHTPFYGQHVGDHSTYDNRVLDTVSTYGLACEGSRCTLATREVDGYGNGTMLTPIAGADELLVAKGIALAPGRGVLVSRLTALDEKTRELAFVSLDGKLKWSAAELKDRYYGVRDLGDYMLVDHTELGSAQERRRYDAHLIDYSGRVVWSARFPPRDNWWDQGLDAAVVRYDDSVLIGAQGEVVAMPIGPGKELWRYSP